MGTCPKCPCVTPGWVGVHRHDEAEKRLPKASLVLLAKFEPVLQWTKHCDNVLYQGLVEILIPDVLRPIPSEHAALGPALPHPRRPGPAPFSQAPPPGALTQAIRNFAKSLESWLTHAMVNIPEEMLRVKVRCKPPGGQGRQETPLQRL